MRTVHKLKTLPVYFDAVDRGDKPFEVRFDDRGFQSGDILELVRLENDGTLTDDAVRIRRRVMFVLTDEFPGLAHGYVAMGLSDVLEPST